MCWLKPDQAKSCGIFERPFVKAPALGCAACEENAQCMTQ